MQLVSSHHAYPLIGAYAQHMISNRCTLLDNATINIHPITAHNFNFDLTNIQLLNNTLLATHDKNQNISTGTPLTHYEHQLQLTT